MRTNVRRLTFWVFAAVFVLLVVLLYSGKVSFGGMTASGAKLAINADYAIAAMLGAFSFFLMHFTATLCADPVAQDFRLGVSPLLRSSPIQARTYLVGRFLGGYVSVLAIYSVFLIALIVAQPLAHLGIKSSKVEVLPVRIWPFLTLAVWFLLVPTFFVGALSFAIGTLTRNMRMVYIAVTSFLIAWLLIFEVLGDDKLRFLAYWEPTGMAWLSETVAKSRGNAWLNEHPIVPDLGFLLNRIALTAIGFAALAWTVVRFPRLDLESDAGGAARSSMGRRALAWFRGVQPAVEDRYENWVGHKSVPVVEPARRGPRAWLAQLWASTATELRLLLGERSLWIMAPVIMLFAGATVESFDGAFGLPLYPVSSEFAAQMVFPLLLFLAGTTIFYTGEVFHRDEASGVRSIIYATPVTNGAVLLAKYFSMVLLSLGMVFLTALTVMVNQLVRWWFLNGTTYFDAGPFLQLGWAVVVPAVLTMCSVALFVNVLVRGRYVAYFALILIGAAYVWYVPISGNRSLLWNPLLVGHWVYSDLTQLESFAEALRLHHVYWGFVVVALLAFSTWLLGRTQGDWRRLASPAAMLRTPLGVGTALAASAGAFAVGMTVDERGTLRGSRWERELEALAYEDRYRAQFDAPRLTYDRIDLEVALHPEQRSLDVAGTLSLVNAWPQRIREAYFTIDPLYTIRRFELDGSRGEPLRDGAVLRFELDPPLDPGQRTTLHLDWSGTVNPGFAENGGSQSTFLLPSAVFISSFGPEIVPVTGISPDLFLMDEERRMKHDREKLQLLVDRSLEPFVPSGFNCDVPFQFRARIEAPSSMQVLSGGLASPAETAGDRTRTTWKSDGPVRSFAILAYDFAQDIQGGDQVYFHRDHAFNVATVMSALRDARATFGRLFAPYPHEQLKIAEFPRVASFAQSYPTLMPYSESIGFLTNYQKGGRFVDVTYFVTAHEVAHQWWAYVLHPGASLGAQVLAESLAEYSAMLLLDEHRGERMRLVFLKNEEDRYLRGRDPDKEVPLVKLENEGGVYWYNKGSLVFYMLERRIGREAVVAALSAFAHTWSARAASELPTHPTITDLLGTLRRQHPGVDLDWFYDQWFREVMMPDVRIDSASLRKSGDTWLVDFEATNVGTGRAIVLAEAYSGSWDLEDDEPADDFRASAGLRLDLGPGESERATLTATFGPSHLILDRLFETIDFDRTNNLLELGDAQEVEESEPDGAPAGGRD